MPSSPKYSVVIPVYNRPEEVEELLQSLIAQSFRDFEVILVEDGSNVTSQQVFEKYSSVMPIQYFFKPNSGPGPTRNFGFQNARGYYLVTFDSDCLIPQDYFRHVDDHLKKIPLDVWGGPDRGHPQFTPSQQAMAYTMSSVLTTGGIRGARSHMGSFQPRSFNMGMSRSAFELTEGFRFDRYAEDIEFSIRSRKLGLRTGLIPEAYVFHKRRSNLEQFFRQVMNFGGGRVAVGRVHPGEIKITHWFPTLFLLGIAAIPFLLLFNTILAGLLLALYLFYILAVAVGAFRVSRRLSVSAWAIPSVVVQMTGYGYGFLKAMVADRPRKRSRVPIFTVFY